MLKRWVLALCVVLGVAVSVAVPVVFASRNSAGTYSLPSGTTVSAGQTITPTWANTFTADVATELTNSLDRTGRGAMSQPLQLSNGSAASPSLTFASDSNTGLYRIGSDNMGLTLGGSKLLDFSTTTPLAVTGNATVSGTSNFTGLVTGSNGVTVTRSSVNTSAVTATGNGSGHGVNATGGSTGAGANLQGGGTSGSGVIATAGAGNGLGGYLVGTGNSRGVEAVGGTTGVGGRFYSGTSGGAGVNGAEGYAQTATANTNNAFAFAAKAGHISLEGGNPSSTTAFSNVLAPTSIVKAWAHLSGTGGTWVVSEGFNIASVSCTSNEVRVNLATAMSSSTTYLTVVNGDTAVSNGTWMKANPNASASQVKILNYSCTGGAGCTVSQENLCTATGTIHLIVLGAQ